MAAIPKRNKGRNKKPIRQREGKKERKKEICLQKNSINIRGHKIRYQMTKMVNEVIQAIIKLLNRY